MNGPRLVGLLSAAAAALGAAGYLVVYLYRWQWQRAIVSGVLLLVVLLLILGFLVLDRLSRLERRLGERQDAQRAGLLALLRHAEADADADAGRGGPGRHGGPGRPRFAWLESPEDPSGHHTHVFVPILMAAGAALAGLAWLVERVARRTVRPAARSRLAGRLAPLAAPPGGLLDDRPDLPERPLPGSIRRPRVLAAVVLMPAVAAGVVLGLAELTRTEPPGRGPGEATTVLFHVRGNAVDEARTELAAQQLWERCRDATSVPLHGGGLVALGGNRYSGTVAPALSDHDQHRLRGCLEDTRLDRVLLTVEDITALGR